MVDSVTGLRYAEGMVWYGMVDVPVPPIIIQGILGGGHVCLLAVDEKDNNCNGEVDEMTLYKDRRYGMVW